jgi:hypothetical protein
MVALIKEWSPVLVTAAGSGVLPIVSSSVGVLKSIVGDLPVTMVEIYSDRDTKRRSLAVSARAAKNL